MTEAEILFTEILCCGRPDLYLNKDRVLSADELARISQALERRMRGEPLQYILGKTEFMGLEFKVAPCVLIPRPETELLVEKTIEACSKFMVHGSLLDILDIGTGSGCIAVSLAKLLPGARITATDISNEALKVARENAKNNNVDVRFIHSDIFSSYDLRPTTYDLIIANPPYIASEDIDKLQRELQYEPKVALDGGPDGLDFYRRIIAQAPAYLKDNGLLILEIGFAQTEKMKDIFLSSDKMQILEITKDYNGIDRIITSGKR